MQKSTYLISTLIVFFILNLSACGNKYGDAKQTMKNQISIFENYIDSMNTAENADDVVTAVTTFSTKMNAMIPELKKIADKYPELANENEAPAELKEEYDRITELSEKVSEAMMKNFKYMTDPKVQKAFMEQGKILNETVSK